MTAKTIGDGVSEVAGAIARTDGRAPSLLPLAVRLAWRDLTGGGRGGGLRGFAVFLACIALGVGAIAGVGALGDSLDAAFLRQGQVLLGGDVALSTVHQRPELETRAWLTRHGRVSEAATLRAMAWPVANASGGEDRRPVLVELKAVDAAYPLYGEMLLSDGTTLSAGIGDGKGAVVDPILLERLGLRLGDRIRIANTAFVIRATIAREPDRLTSRTAYGPRVLIGLRGLEATGLVRPGSLVRWRTRLALPGASGPNGPHILTEFGKALHTRFPEAGFQIRDRRDPVPAIRRAIERFGQFLTLVGLTALLVGGIGVANAVATYMDRKRKTIAILKSLGASGRTVLCLYLVEVLALAGLGILAGLALGSLVPLVARAAAGDALPVAVRFALRPATIASGVAYGFLVALLFVLWPLGRAGRVRPSVLFRGPVAGMRGWPGWRFLAAILIVLALLVALAILTAGQQRIAVYFCIGLAALFAIFLGLGEALRRIAGTQRRQRRPTLALALANLSGPGALTRSVVLSLGTGLTLMVTISLTDAALVGELARHVPSGAPGYFVLDIDKGQYDAFSKLVRRAAPGVEVSSAPMLRGRIIAMKGTPVEALHPPAEAEWVLRGDRGLTFAREVPKGSRIVAGKWWPADFRGPPLVSFAADIARAFALHVGDTVTVNVLGRNLTARIANLREVNWESLAINFVMVFPPDTLKGAPYTRLATLRLPDPDNVATEGRMVQAAMQAFPTLTFIRVRDALAAIDAIFAKVMLAVRLAGSVTLLAGAIVVAGALATAERRRIYQAVVLKALGATRRCILTAHLVEYLILAATSALFASLLGTIAAWLVVTRIMELAFVFSASAIVEVLLLAIVLTLAFGAAGTWRVLQAPAMPWLRSE